jgi:hypothetical protein
MIGLVNVAFWLQKRYFKKDPFGVPEMIVHPPAV